MEINLELVGKEAWKANVTDVIQYIFEVHI